MKVFFYLLLLWCVMNLLLKWLVHQWLMLVLLLKHLMIGNSFLMNLLVLLDDQLIVLGDLIVNFWTALLWFNHVFIDLCLLLFWMVCNPLFLLMNDLLVIDHMLRRLMLNRLKFCLSFLYNLMLMVVVIKLFDAVRSLEARLLLHFNLVGLDDVLDWDMTRLDIILNMHLLHSFPMLIRCSLCLLLAPCWYIFQSHLFKLAWLQCVILLFIVRIVKERSWTIVSVIWLFRVG